jgi:hypothetical protein
MRGVDDAAASRSFSGCVAAGTIGMVGVAVAAGSAAGWLHAASVSVKMAQMTNVRWRTDSACSCNDAQKLTIPHSHAWIRVRIGGGDEIERMRPLYSLA